MKVAFIVKYLVVNKVTKVTMNPIFIQIALMSKKQLLYLCLRAIIMSNLYSLYALSKGRISLYSTCTYTFRINGYVSDNLQIMPLKVFVN